MNAQSSAAHQIMSPAPTHRWSEFVTKRNLLHCGPAPFGHHMPDIFGVTEAGFARCQREVPNLAPELVQLEALYARRMAREAEQLSIVLRQRGVRVPSKDEIAAMTRDSGTSPCGRWIFLFAIRGGGIVVAEVSLDEKRDMEHLSTPTEMIDYLGVLNTNR